MGNLSIRYSYTITKKYDGMPKGSSILWSERMQKAYGVLSKKLDHHTEFDKNDEFDYSFEQISIARHLRIGYYKRLIKPEDIINALYYSPVSLEVEIFDSIFNDQDGIITMPDSDDIKEEYGHCFSVMKYNKDDSNFTVSAGNWQGWGRNEFGTISLEYLNKYFITAFATCGFPRLESEKRKELLRKKIKLFGKKYYTHIFLENNFKCDSRLQLNFEVMDAGGNLTGWGHFAFSKNKTLELLDVFILEEYRRRGIGSMIINNMIDFIGAKKFTGCIDGHDLIGNREDIVKDFLLKNGFMAVVDRSEFKDAKFRIECIS